MKPCPTIRMSPFTRCASRNVAFRVSIRIKKQRGHVGTHPGTASFICLVYSKLSTMRPVCEPSTHLAWEEGPTRSVVFTLLRTGGITFITEMPVLGKV